MPHTPPRVERGPQAVSAILPNLDWLLDYEIQLSSRYRRFLSLVLVGAEVTTLELNQVLSGTIRSSDVCFPEAQGLSVVMGETESSDAVQAIQRYNNAVNGSLALHHAVATYPADGATSSELKAAAARRLAVAKTLGKGSYVTSG